jgi:hypothetical protein
MKLHTWTCELGYNRFSTSRYYVLQTLENIEHNQPTSYWIPCSSCNLQKPFCSVTWSNEYLLAGSKHEVVPFDFACSPIPSCRIEILTRLKCKLLWWSISECSLESSLGSLLPYFLDSCVSHWCPIYMIQFVCSFQVIQSNYLCEVVVAHL